jgi:hypothetical protein
LGDGKEIRVVMEAFRYAQVEPRWLDTKFKVASSTARLSIRATGTLDFGFGSEVVITPAGPTRSTGRLREPMSLRTGSGMPGVLIGRVGASGREFVVGESYEASPGQSGTLFLRIEPHTAPRDLKGSYTVTIRNR